MLKFKFFSRKKTNIVAQLKYLVALAKGPSIEPAPYSGAIALPSFFNYNAESRLLNNLTSKDLFGTERTVDN